MSSPGSLTFLLQNAATADGNGTPANVDGFDVAQNVEIVEANTGTCTVVLSGSFDGTNWYVVGYQQIDNTLTPARSVSAISVTQNMKHVYQILDAYPQLRAVVSSSSSQTVTVKLYAVGSN